MAFMHFEAMSVAASVDVVTLSGSLGAPNTANHSSSTSGTARAGWLFGVADAAPIEKGTLHRRQAATYDIPKPGEWTDNKAYTRNFWIRARHDPDATGDSAWGVAPTEGSSLDTWTALSGTDPYWYWTSTSTSIVQGVIEVSISIDSGGSVIIATGYYKGYAKLATSSGGGGGGCFTGNMRILMADGTQKCIADILIGDTVMSLSASGELVPARVNDIMVPRICDIYEVKLSNGKVIETTSEHPFRTADGLWANIDPTATYQSIIGGENVSPNVDIQLQSGMMLCGAEENARITKIIDTGRKETVYHLSNVGTYHNFFVEGMCVHNLEQQKR